MRLRQKGISLVDLMLATAVVGVIAAAALPSYRRHAIQAQRSEGTSALVQAAAALERCFGRVGAYNHPSCKVESGLPRDLPSGHYRIELAQSAASRYRLTAVPQGEQAADEDCRSFSFDSNNNKTVSADATRSANFCWGASR